MEAEKNFQPDEQPENSGHDMEETIDQEDQTAREEDRAHEAAEGEGDESPEAAEPAQPVEAAPEASAPAEQVAGYDESSLKKWFIIHTYSGFENKVAESLRTRADAFGFADKIGQILIPTEEVIELRNGKKV